MSAVGDYLIWLEENGHVHFNPRTDNYEWDGEDPLTDDVLYEQYLNNSQKIQEDQHGWSPEEFWFTENGGLTAEAYHVLSNMDSQGDFV